MIRGEVPLAMLKKEKGIHRAICEFLDSIMHERGNRLVIFIDELDRCKPEYAGIRTYHFELREIAKYLKLTKVAAYKATHGEGYSFSFSEGHGTEFCLLYVIPIMIGIKIHDMDVYENFIYGKNDKPLLELFNNIEDVFLMNY